MWNFLFGFSIRARVLSVIKERIKAAEERFTTLCTQIDDDARRQKEKAADAMVSDILSAR